MFLRHLRRTRVLVHVVDASTPNPVEDYSILREVSHRSLHEIALQECRGCIGIHSHVQAHYAPPYEWFVVLIMQELHLYNPEYTRRPHVVVLNKLDIPEVIYLSLPLVFFLASTFGLVLRSLHWDQSCEVVLFQF